MMSDNESTEWEVIDVCPSSFDSETSNNVASGEFNLLHEKLKEANIRAEIAEAKLAKTELELDRQKNEHERTISSKLLLRNQVATLQDKVNELQLQLEASPKQQSLLQLLKLEDIGSRQARRLALRENHKKLKKNLKQNQRHTRHQQKQVGKAKKQLRHPMNVPSRHSSSKRVQYWN